MCKRIHWKQSRGFTLVELLVVIAIIGILVALLLPAIQAAREAARRAACINNLKNLGLAALNHHDVHQHFPVSMGHPLDSANVPAGTALPAVGWILNTLPQLEEQPLYDQFRAAGAFEGSFVNGLCLRPTLGKGLASIKNGISAPELMKAQLSVLQCPSDTSVQQLSEDQYQWARCAVALTSYKGVLDDTWTNLEFSTFNNDLSRYPSGMYDDSSASRDCHRDTRCRGIFFRESFLKPVKIAKITDGASKTLMIGEDVPLYNRHSAAFYSNGDWCSCNAPLNYGIGQDPETIAVNAWYDAQGFRSNHPGGVHFCLADGSARFISDSVDNIVYRTSCTRDGNEVVTGQL